MAITVRVQTEEPWETIYLSGKIDEDAEVTLGELKDKVGIKCIFNFKEITGINSCGVRAWINFLREVEKRGTDVIFDECTPDIISQINMIPNFKGKAKIQSLYASYTCSNNHQHLHLFQEGVNMPKTPSDKIAHPPCPNCGVTMEMEELEDEFFDWLN